MTVDRIEQGPGAKTAPRTLAVFFGTANAARGLMLLPRPLAERLAWPAAEREIRQPA